MPQWECLIVKPKRHLFSGCFIAVELYCYPRGWVHLSWGSGAADGGGFKIYPGRAWIGHF